MTTHAPPPLELVREFVNTLDLETGNDELSSPEDIDLAVTVLAGAIARLATRAP